MRKKTKRKRSDWWRGLGAHVEETLRLFSEKGREDREWMVVQEFLRTLGVPVKRSDLKTPGQHDDVDVYFHEARFQNVERMEKGRRRNDEFRRFAERVRRARTIADLEVPRPDSTPMTAKEVLAEVVGSLTARKQRKLVNRAELDALVYVNIRGRHLYPAPGTIDDARTVDELGWRSVSALWPPYAMVISATDNAPVFLRERTRRVILRDGIPWET